MRHSTTLASVSLLVLTAAASAQPLPPDDPTIAGDLQLWLQRADVFFNGSDWQDSSGNGNAATPVGFRPGSDPTEFPDTTYLAPTASTEMPNVGPFSGQSLPGVLFDGNADDLLETPSLNGGTGLSDATIFIVYRVAGTNGESRPAGIGSQAADGQSGSGFFNLASDGSLRYDNGNNLGSDDPANLFIRATRLDSGAVTDWHFNSGTIDTTADRTIGPTSSPSGGTIPNPTSTDVFYIGDVRAGVTRVGGSGGGTTATLDQFIAQVVVYNAALSDANVGRVAEWILANPAGIVPPVIDVELTLASNAPVRVGQSYIATVTVENIGSSSASSVVVTLPEMGTLNPAIAFDAGNSSASVGSVGESGGVVTWTVGNLADGATETATVAFTTSAVDTIDLSAVATLGSTDVDLSNNAASLTGEVITFSTDVNFDGAVNTLDVDILAAAFGSSDGDAVFDADADIDGNLAIDLDDLSLVVADLGLPIVPPTFTFVSTPDILNADVFDISASPFNSGFQSTNAQWQTAIAAWMTRLAGENPEFVMVAGDLSMQRWTLDAYNEGVFGPLVGTVGYPTLDVATEIARVELACDLFYPQFVQYFADAGLTPVCAVGDHELGDDENWEDYNPPRVPAGMLPVSRQTIPTLRQRFAQYLVDPLFAPGGIGDSRPATGQHSGSAFSVRFQNVLVITVDVFEQKMDGDVDAQLGAEQLAWLQNRLTAANNDPSIDFIIVQGHTPIIGNNLPARNSSRLYFEGGSGSDLWQAMEAGNVDLYLCGELHVVSVRQASTDTPVQIVHGAAWGFTGINTMNYMLFEVDGDEMTLTIKEYPFSASGSPLFQASDVQGVRENVSLGTTETIRGTLTIDKSSGSAVFSNATGVFNGL